LRRTDEWVFAPEKPYERQGDVNSVVFPCGWVLDKASGAIRLYYGGADTCLALATAQLSDLLGYLGNCPAPPTLKRGGNDLAGLTVTIALSVTPRENVTNGRPAPARPHS
jgi:beta-1,4-mannooligosaccharide phosphorylase